MLPRFCYWLNGRLYLSVTTQKWSKTVLDLKGPSFKFEENSGFQLLTKNYEPSADELFQQVDSAYEQGLITVDSMKSDEITFAGNGEPLIRLETILEAASSIKESRHGVPLRVLTTGLVSSNDALNIATSLKQSGIKNLSIGLIADNPKVYNELMKPTNGRSFNDVCSFISVSVEAGLNVNCVAVERPEVNIKGVRSLALSLGASAFNTYKYYP